MFPFIDVHRKWCTWALLALCLCACSKTSDEALLQAALEDMAHAIENKQPKRVLEHVADGFHGPNDLTHDGVRGLLAYHLLRNQKIRVFVSGVQIEVKGQGADVRFKATLTGAEGLVPERLQYYDVHLAWWKNKKQWSIVGADWEPIFGSN